MLHQPTYLVCIFLVLITKSHGQLNPALCPDGPTITNKSAIWGDVPNRFEIVLEYIDIAGKQVGEISQAFSEGRDTVFFNTANGSVNLYWNFLTNEQFEILPIVRENQALQTCFRQTINSGSKTSILLPNSRILKPSILLGYNMRNKPNPLWGVRDAGTSLIRDIPVNVFTSCFYVDDIQGTVKATYYRADLAKVQTYYLPGLNISVLVQIDVDIATPSGRETYSYNVYRYTPQPSRREERQALETPSGAFCPDRTPTKAFPERIPERSSANGELTGSNFNNSIISTHNLYDTEYQFTRADAWFGDPYADKEWQHMTFIHDFGMGLSYRYNHSSYQCRVHNISLRWGDAVSNTDNPNLVQMGSPQHLFALDNVTYHYTGEKPCHDRIWCDVWIGQGPSFNNTIEQREWYWAIRFNEEPLTTSFPAKLITKRYQNGLLIEQLEYNIFHYRRHPMTLAEIDHTLTNCYLALGPSANFNLAVLSFKVANDNKYPVFQNLNYLRRHIFEHLVDILSVIPVRLSHLLVDSDDKDILVTFTLLDTPPSPGNVEKPREEPSLDSLVERLTNIIDSNGLSFRGRYDYKQVSLRARPNSLNVLHRSAETKYKSTGGTITGLWIGLIIAGSAIAFVVCFIVYRLKAN